MKKVLFALVVLVTSVGYASEIPEGYKRIVIESKNFMKDTDYRRDKWGYREILKVEIQAGAIKKVNCNSYSFFSIIKKDSWSSNSYIIDGNPEYMSGTKIYCGDKDGNVIETERFIPSESVVVELPSEIYITLPESMSVQVRIWHPETSYRDAKATEVDASNKKK